VKLKVKIDLILNNDDRHKRNFIMDIRSILLGKMENDVKLLCQEIQQISAEVKAVSMNIDNFNRERLEKEKYVTQFDNEVRDCHSEIEESRKNKSPRELKSLLAELRTRITDIEKNRNLVKQDIAFIDDKIRKGNLEIRNLLNKKDDHVMKIEDIKIEIERVKKIN